MHRAVGVLLLLMIVAVLGVAYSTRPEPRPWDAVIGYGCGPEKDTYLAAEEDHLPECERIIPNPIYTEN